MTAKAKTPVAAKSIAKLFMHGRSQAVRLPKEYRFEGEEVRVKSIPKFFAPGPHPTRPPAEGISFRRRRGPRQQGRRQSDPRAVGEAAVRRRRLVRLPGCAGRRGFP